MYANGDGHEHGNPEPHRERDGDGHRDADPQPPGNTNGAAHGNPDVHPQPDRYTELSLGTGLPYNCRPKLIRYQLRHVLIQRIVYLLAA